MSWNPARRLNGQCEYDQINASTGEGKHKENGNSTFLFESGNSLPIARAFVAVLRPRLPLLRPVPTRGTANRSGSTRWQLDELHAKRLTEDLLRLVEHSFERAALRAHHLFRDVVAAEWHAPLLLEERETHQIGRALFQILLVCV